MVRQLGDWSSGAGAALGDCAVRGGRTGWDRTGQDGTGQDGWARTTSRTKHWWAAGSWPDPCLPLPMQLSWLKWDAEFHFLKRLPWSFPSFPWAKLKLFGQTAQSTVSWSRSAGTILRDAGGHHSQTQQGFASLNRAHGGYVHIEEDVAGWFSDHQASVLHFLQLTSPEVPRS